MLHPSTSQLCALTCKTEPSVPLTKVVGADGAEMRIAAPLGDKVCCVVDDPVLRAQICAQLQLIAASQSIHHPWLSLAGLYRVIVTQDRRSAVLANKGLLEAIGQSVEMYEGERGAFAFPCEHGVVVVLPMHIVGYALAPDTEFERQYGITTIWHELAHAHALMLDYLPEGKLRMPKASTLLRLASLMWHEFFADRHSHWPGFSCAFEHQLVENTWEQVCSDPTSGNVEALVVNVAKAFGRLGAFQTETNPLIAAFAQAQAFAPIASAWQACANDLENALATLITSNVSPDMRALERSSQALVLTCQSVFGGDHL